MLYEIITRNNDFKLLEDKPISEQIFDCSKQASILCFKKLQNVATCLKFLDKIWQQKEKLQY